MKLELQTEKELALLEEQIRFFRMVNGVMAGAFFVGCAYVIYKVVGVFL